MKNTTKIIRALHQFSNIGQGLYKSMTPYYLLLYKSKAYDSMSKGNGHCNYLFLHSYAWIEQ